MVDQISRSKLIVFRLVGYLILGGMHACMQVAEGRRPRLRLMLMLRLRLMLKLIRLRTNANAKAEVLG